MDYTRIVLHSSYRTIIELIDKYWIIPITISYAIIPKDILISPLQYYYGTPCNSISGGSTRIAHLRTTMDAFKGESDVPRAHERGSQ
jgi:hypothetical protein